MHGISKNLSHVFPSRPSLNHFMLNKSRGKVISSMASPETDQRLQNITLSKVPVPDKNIDCQALLRQDVSHKGWLRRKKPGKLTKALGSLLPSIMWEQLYVVLCKGCLYFYNNEFEKKPLKALSLFGYTRVMRANELQCRQAGLWPFKVAYVLDEHDRVHYFSAVCEEDMMKWLKHIKLELYRANGVDYSDDSIIDEDIHDLETPISTENYFQRIQGLNEIKEVVEDDSDMDSEYDYIETGEDLPKPPFSGLSSSSSSNTRGQTPPRNPVVLPPSKPVRARPQTPPKSSRASPPSPGYYPPSAVNLETALSASTKPLPAPPAAKKLPSTPVVQPNKPPPVKAKGPGVMPKQKSSTAGEGGGGREAPAKTPSGESVAFVSVADLQKAIADRGTPKKPATGKASVQPSKPSGHFPVAEKMSSPPVTTSKPLPAVPKQTRESNAPTAVVMPIRQSNRFGQDLEASALWTQDGGEGQRLLMSLGREGVYMLRCCSDGSQSLTLLVVADCQLRKYKVFTNEAGMFSLQTDFAPSFDSVHNLLNHYRTNFLPNRQTKLSQSYSELQR